MASKRSRTRRKRGPGLVSTLRDPDKIRVAYIIAGFALVFGGSLGFGASRCDSNQPGAGPGGVHGDVIAQIEDHEITWTDFVRDYNAERARQEAASSAVLHPEEWEANVKYSTLQKMLDMEYFDIRAGEAGITVSPEQIDEQIEQYRSQIMPPQAEPGERSILQRIGDALSSAKEDKAFEMRLKQFDPTMTVNRLKDIIEQNLMAQQFMTQLTSQKDFEIMTELKDRMEGIREEITSGTDFAEMATGNSEHYDSSGAGGLIPIIKHDSANLPKPVIDTAFSLPVDEIGQPIKIDQPEFKGYWLITVLSRIEASGEDWTNSRESLRQQILDEKKDLVEAGELELPEDGNLTVSEEELINAYEETSIRVIYLKAEDPMGRIQQFVRDDQQTMDIRIYDPEIRAMHHIVNEQWALAGADYQEALMANWEKYDTELDNQYVIDMGEARLRYLIANLWASKAFMAEAEWMQKIWQEFQNNPDLFSGDFPEAPEGIKEQQQGYFVLSIMNLSRAIELEEADVTIEAKNPWYHWQRAQLDVAREQLTIRLIDDLAVSHEYSSDDFDLEQRILSVVNQAIALDDAALESAGDVRPESWIDPVFPENEMGLTLDQLDMPFVELMEEVQEETQTDDTAVETPSDDTPVEENETDEIDISVVEIDIVADEESEDHATETAVDDENPVESTEIPEPDSVPELTDEDDLSGYIPVIPIIEPNGPYTQEIRDRLDDLQFEVQTAVDGIVAMRQALEAEEQARREQQIQQLEMNMPDEDDEATSDEADNLLTPESEETE